MTQREFETGLGDGLNTLNSHDAGETGFRTIGGYRVDDLEAYQAASDEFLAALSLLNGNNGEYRHGSLQFRTELTQTEVEQLRKIRDERYQELRDK